MREREIEKQFKELQQEIALLGERERRSKLSSAISGH